MNATLTNVRFPIRLDPVPGESFDGWLDAYAQRLLMSTRELSWALGLPPQLLRQRGMTLAKGSPALDAEQIAARACGLEPAQVEALWLGLARYDRSHPGSRDAAPARAPCIDLRGCSDR